MGWFVKVWCGNKETCFRPCRWPWRTDDHTKMRTIKARNNGEVKSIARLRKYYRVPTVSWNTSVKPYSVLYNKIRQDKRTLTFVFFCLSRQTSWCALTCKVLFFNCRQNIVEQSICFCIETTGNKGRRRVLSIMELGRTSGWLGFYILVLTLHWKPGLPSRWNWTINFDGRLAVIWTMEAKKCAFSACLLWWVYFLMKGE